MGKKIKALLAVVLLNGNVFVVASDIAGDMETLAEKYGKVLKADSPEILKQNLQLMRIAALDAEKGVPSKLKDKGEDSAEIKDYRHGMSLLIKQIDQAQALVDQGKFHEAKAAAEQFKETRNIYHKKYR